MILICAILGYIWGYICTNCFEGLAYYIFVIMGSLMLAAAAAHLEILIKL